MHQTVSSTLDGRAPKPDSIWQALGTKDKLAWGSIRGETSRRREKEERVPGGYMEKTAQLRGGGNLNGYCESVQWREKEELQLNPDTVQAGGAWKKSVDEGAKF